MPPCPSTAILCRTAVRLVTTSVPFGHMSWCNHSSKTRSVTVVWVPCHSQDRLITARANTWACYHIKVQTAYSVGFTKAPKAPSNLSRPIVLVLLFLSAREANMAAQNGIGKEVGWARGRGS